MSIMMIPMILRNGTVFSFFFRVMLYFTCIVSMAGWLVPGSYWLWFGLVCESIAITEGEGKKGHFYLGFVCLSFALVDRVWTMVWHFCLFAWFCLSVSPALCFISFPPLYLLMVVVCVFTLPSSLFYYYYCYCSCWNRDVDTSWNFPTIPASLFLYRFLLVSITSGIGGIGLVKAWKHAWIQFTHGLGKKRFTVSQIISFMGRIGVFA